MGRVVEIFFILVVMLVIVIHILKLRVEELIYTQFFIIHTHTHKILVIYMYISYIYIHINICICVYINYILFYNM